MAIEQVNELCDILFSLKYKPTDYKYDLTVINRENQKQVKETIISFVNNKVARRNSELEAKVYAYEKIISNSNFAPLIEIKNEQGGVE